MSVMSKFTLGTVKNAKDKQRLAAATESRANAALARQQAVEARKSGKAQRKAMAAPAPPAPVAFDPGESARRAAAQVIPPPPPSTGQWIPDISGRHEFRWYDGTAWTDSVSDAGVVSTDPV